MLPSKRELFGVNVSATRYDEVVAAVIGMAQSRRPATVDFMCVHGLVHAAKDAKFRQVINDFDIVATDGQPVRWAMNKFNDACLADRVYGPETMWRTCAAAAKAGVSVYLYGAGQDVIDVLVKLLPEKHPGLIIAGAESPPFRKLTAEEEAETAKRINASGAGIVFIGIGCPKQEEFAWRNRHAIEGVQMCVGAAFDMHAGTKPMAPRWMQKRGLEWLYRLGQEPGRLWKRYLVNNSQFVMLVGKRLLRGAPAAQLPMSQVSNESTS
jgi:N-acetylglucosaminyldiphosphoundecaprenol N-acetyl-beta-D-mannosaminyltransferase